MAFTGKHFQAEEEYFHNELNALEILNKEEIHSHICAYQKNGDKETLHVLIHSHLRFVRKVAHDFLEAKRKLFPSVTLEELIAPGVKGLLIAIKKFDTSRKTTLGAYAGKKIWTQIQRYCIKHRSTIRIPEGVWFRYEAVPQWALLKQENPTPPQHATYEYADDIFWNMEDPQATPESMDAEYDVYNILSKLSKRSSTVIFNYYITEMNQKEIAKELNMSQQNIVLMLGKARKEFRSLCKTNQKIPALVA